MIPVQQHLYRISSSATAASRACSLREVGDKLTCVQTAHGQSDYDRPEAGLLDGVEVFVLANSSGQRTTSMYNGIQRQTLINYATGNFDQRPAAVGTDLNPQRRRVLLFDGYR